MKKSQGYKRRKKLFEIFSKNLSNVKKHPSITIEPDIDEGVICPICMKLFPREALSHDKGYEDPLTLEDIPPKSLGGEVRTLTCKICNNTAGSQLESHLKNRLEFEEAMSGETDSSLDGAIRTENNIRINASIEVNEDKFIKIFMDPDRSDPKDIQQFTSILNTGKTPDFSLDFFGKFRLNRPEVALLRIGYLIAYSTFGLGFILNPNLEIIRNQINNPKDKIINPWGVYGFDFPPETVGINIIREPKKLRAFFIVFDLETTYKVSRFGVLLPGPTEPGTDIYKFLRGGNSKKSQDMNIQASHIFEKDYLTDSQAAFASNNLWLEVLNMK